MRHRLSFRVTLAGVVVVILVTAIGLAMSVSGSPRTNHVTTSPTLPTLPTSIGAVTFSTKNLPPSRDNDAGRARSIDATPDNDTDAWQRG